MKIILKFLGIIIFIISIPLLFFGLFGLIGVLLQYQLRSFGIKGILDNDDDLYFRNR